MEKYDGPTYNEMMPQLFQAIKELGGSGTVDEIDQKTIKLLNLSEETANFPHNGSNKTEVEYRLAWTRTYMKKVGILENSSRGVWALTAKGRELQTIDPNEIVAQVRTMSFLKLDKAEMIKATDDNPENDGVDTPDEIQSWRDKLRNVLQNLSPDAFERLTQRMLLESGFVQVQVTGRTGDGGIDGTGMSKENKNQFNG
jgi:restriction system protein